MKGQSKTRSQAATVRVTLTVVRKVVPDHVCSPGTPTDTASLLMEMLLSALLQLAAGALMTIARCFQQQRSPTRAKGSQQRAPVSPGLTWLGRHLQSCLTPKMTCSE